MPVAPGGFEAQVPLSEKRRLAAGEVVEETENLQRDYDLCPTTPEDYASLASTLTYTWMESVQRLSLHRPLVPSDIWRLRSINDTRTLSRKFATLQFSSINNKKRSLAKRLIMCNANDIALDFTYKVCGVTLAYAGPALMRSILECISDAAAIEGMSIWTLRDRGFHHQSNSSIEARVGEDSPVWTPRSKAFVLALLGLAFTLVRYVAELKNFHHARQVGLRIRSVLVIELLEKALKRRDMKGAINIDKAKEEEEDAAVEEAQEALDTAKLQVHDQDDLNALGADLNDTAREEGEQETSALLGAAHDNRQQDRKAKKPKLKKKDSLESQADVGKVVNMMAEDINTLLRLGCDSHQLYGAPIEVIIATTFLYQLMGWSALAGLSLLIIALPINYLVGKWYMKSAVKWRKATDERISLVTELLMAIRFIKLQGVQERWIEKIMAARYNEMWQMIYANMNEFCMIILWVAIPISVTIFTFFIYVTFQGQELTIPVAFTALTLFSMLRSPLDVIPAFAMSILRAVVSIRRLESFLEEEEIEDCISAFRMQDKLSHQGDQNDAIDEPLSIEKGHFTWQSSQTQRKGKKCFTLSDVSVSFPLNGLSVIEGPTASGKSSLLAALLGEMRRISGTQTMPKFGKGGQCLFSFAGQTPWMEAGKSVKKNILFITPYEEERYRAVLHACALEDDLREWEEGDATRISKETLSGGQKARISLARAMYSRSKTVFLDDVLSAVDTRVQNHIYQHALTGPLAQDRRIILVTHHVSLVLPSVKYLVRLHSGKVIASGTVVDLQARGLLEDVQLHKSSPSTSSESSQNEETKVDDTAGDADGDHDQDQGKKGKDDAARLLYDLEGRNVGAVKWDCYGLYLRASSPVLWALVVFASIISRAVAASEQYWLKLWGEASIRPSFGLPPARDHQTFYLGVYGFIGLATVLTIIFRSALYYTAAYKASKELYTLLLHSVVRARMRFFDKNPTGRILQRFNSDFSLIDGQLPLTFLRLTANSLAFASSALICIFIVPAFSILLVVCVGLSYFVRGFLRSTMYMQRIEATSTSPLYNAFAQILDGLVTVRAFAAEQYFLDQMQTITAITSAQWWAIATMEVWISFRSQIISGVAVFVATCLALSGAVSPGSAGMVIASSNLVTTYVYWLTLDYKHLSNNSNSIERIKEYVELEQEAPEKCKDHPIPAAWPSSEGGIQIRDLSVRYDKDLPEVLHSISFDVKNCEKVAIVGRTGSGKTSLISTFLRATEPSDAKSKIIVDGLDIFQLGLEYRNRLTIVPQDPILFSGTIRQNLDPFEEKSDEECQWALDQVHINKHSRGEDQQEGGGGDEVKGSDHNQANQSVALVKLTTKVAAGGSNFSAGQAQLISLARALLRDARIVILDEATSSTDFETDAAIQRSIREMKQSIIIAVAHRLTTVIDYDRVLVLSRGNIVEFDTPYNLLNKSDDDQEAHFKSLCKEAGPIAYKQLCQAAGLQG
ncbi:hypothetical protein CBS101457_003988 [Exobasidium rhododendri]|nr:hypothetical protein CBS101457_003988 [Exobasidium rhododendri]